MSDQYFDLKAKQAINELNDIYNMEFIPFEENQARGLRFKRSPKEWFDFYARLYLSYLDTYKKLEDVYDQLTHPQKRKEMYDILTRTIGRLMQIKDDLIMFNVDTKAVNSDFFNLDELLFDMKILPSRLEIPIPRFGKELNPDIIRKRDETIRTLLERRDGDDPLPEEEELVYKDLDQLQQSTAMHVILVNERGRQGIQKAIQKREELKNNMKGRGKKEDKTDEYVLVVQKYYHALIDRKKIHQLRIKEMEFLDMIPDADEELERLSKQVEDLRIERKENQARIQNELIDFKSEIKSAMEINESPDIKEEKLFERRTWMTKYYEEHEGKELPKNAMEFYEYDNVAIPLTPEEEDLRRKEEQEKKKAAQKAKANKGKKKTEREEFLDSMEAKGPENSIYFKQLHEEVDRYNQLWTGKDNKDVFSAKFDPDIIKREVRPEIERKIENEVDEIIKCELASLHLKLGITKKKDKPKRARKVKPIKSKIPGAKQVGNRAIRDLLCDVVNWNIYKMLKPAKMSDFVGEHNMLRTIQEAQCDTQPDPSLAQVRNRVAEFVGIPLATEYFKPGLTNTYLFYGPQGTGKSLMVRALAAETNAIVLDISPYATADTIAGDKKKITEFMYIVFKVAKELQPAIILIDEIEQFFPLKKKKPKGIVLGRCSKLKKDLMAQIKKHLEPSDRVAVIACTNKPYYCNMVDLKKLFQKKFYFPYPDYNSRIEIFEHLCKVNEIPLSDDFPVSQLGLMTEGCTPGSVINIIINSLSLL